MKYLDRDLQKLQQLSYNYSLYRTGDFDLADEISMKTIGVFLLKADEIVSDQASKWIINASKIHIQSHFRTMKQEHANVKKFQQSLLEKLDTSLVTVKDTELSNTFKEALQTLTNDEMKTILYYFQCDQKIRSMHLLLDISYDALRKKISRIKRKLKAETFKKLGVIVSKKIITPRINDLIVKFLKSFKTHLEENSLEKMYYYFSEVDLKKYNPSYEIEKIVDYEIELNETIYKVWVFLKILITLQIHFILNFLLMIIII